MAHSGNYPAHWEADVVLRDGSTMRIRPIRPEDAEALQRFHMSQSERSTYLRFFAPMARLSEEMLARFTQVDHRDRVALVLVDGEAILAVGRFERLDGGDAEVAFNVADSAQGKGLGSVLLEHLAAAGRELGVRRFVADVLPQNARMLRVFADAGYDVQSTMDDGILAVSFTITSTDKSLAVLAEREQRSEALSMAALMRPAGVLLVCAGQEGQAFGRVLLGSLTQEGAPGVQVVGLDGAPGALSSLDQVRPGPDLALLAAPPAQVLDLLEPLAGLGVRGVVLYTGGFAAQAGSERVSQRILRRRARRHGLRLVGPRSYGLITSAADRDGPAPRIEASLYPSPPRPGSVGVFCQSAAAGRALLSGAAARDMGVASFVSAGHRVDVSGNDVMQRWVGDESTAVACLRLESIGNPRKFSRVARRLSQEGPVVTTIAGTTGQLNPPGHEVATSALPRRALDELMRQAGVLVAETVDDSLDLALLLSEQPLPAGDRVLVLTNSGAQAAMITELLRGAEPALTGEVHTLSPTAGVEAYSEQVRAFAGRDDWDAALVGYVPLLTDDGVGVAGQVARLSATSGRTTVAVIDGMRGLDVHLRASGPDGPVRVPAFPTLRTATTALAKATGYVRWREADRGARVDPAGVDRTGAKALVQAELASLPTGSTRRLAGQATTDLLRMYGIELWSQHTVSSLAEALEVAEQIGWPVALKTSDELLRHRLDLGGVRLDLGSPTELAEAYRSVQQRVRSVLGHETTLDIQAMAPGGTATVIEAVEDRMYGPIISFGLAGDASELLGDVSYRVPPLTNVDVASMVRSLGASARLLGGGGLPALNMAGVEDVLARVSVLKEELAEVSAVALHPVLVTETTITVLGARIDVAHPGRGDAARRFLPA
ncbi:GNAT family N-acetyltransferase [Pseudactinotalea sp. Z1732]|uniref:GNAT family N-acetyltransferase n=1 Tax=Micrococcales TaxID=85006 RepID=UPI003C7D6FD2